MSTAIVSAFYDFGDVLSKNNNYTSPIHKAHIKVSERKSVPAGFSIGGSSNGGLGRRTSSPTVQVPLGNNKLLSSSSSGGGGNGGGSNTSSTSSLIASLADLTINGHRKLDRSMSEPVDRQRAAAAAATLAASNGGGNNGGGAANSSRYKTELCRPFEESGKCKYGDKCQFAHGGHELRTLARHPKYKTELCRTFHTIGFCPYGPRCHFIHNAELSPLEGGGGGGPPGGGQGQGGGQHHHQQPQPRHKLGSSADSTCSSSSPSSLSESPNSVGGFFDELVFPPSTPTPSTPTTANNAFTFNSADFASLVPTTPTAANAAAAAAAAAAASDLVIQQQNAYNMALNQVTLFNHNHHFQQQQQQQIHNNHNNNQVNINDLREDAEAEDVLLSSPPSPPRSPVSSIASSDLDNPQDLQGVGGDKSALLLRLPIFSRLSTSED